MGGGGDDDSETGKELGDVFLNVKQTILGLKLIKLFKHF